MRRPTASYGNQIAATALAAALGLILFASRFGDSLARLSYDLPFYVRGEIAAPEVVLVYLDEASAAELGQPPDAAPDRTLHARLLDRMTREGARAVLFDIVFEAPSADPQTDAQFAEAMRRHGTVVLSAAVEVEEQLGTGSEAIVAPTPVLREAAAGWGVAAFEIDADYGVRRIFPGTGNLPSTPAVVAGLLGRGSSFPRTRWLNFYGPPDWLHGVSFAQALRPDGLPPDFFRGRIVVVGGRLSVSHRALRKDEFAGPLSRWGGRFFPGPEVHATALLNLLRGDWLERLVTGLEVACLLIAAVFAGCILNRCSPVRATIAGVLAIAVLCAAAVCGAWFERIWWAWLIPAAVQIPFGVVWSVGTQYLAETRRRAALRRAFSLYLSPHMADKIAASEFDLTPGGQLVEATIMFTDLEGFTTLSEELNDPAALSAVLIQYFRRTTACILENDGTIIKYMGDAVEAVWNAPLADADHAFKAVQAAYRLREVAKFTANGRLIRTRVGISTGPGFAGNLGSEFRFDYAVIGDTTNFAARLESLNKHFGTDILISDATFDQLGGRFVTRPLGQFRVAGKSRPVGIHELIAPAISPPGEPGWLEVFGKGLRAFESGDLRMATGCMEKTCELHGGSDGPAEFFLKTIREIERDGAPKEWTGVIEFTKK
jgi:adenylate cyclase